VVSLCGSHTLAPPIHPASSCLRQLRWCWLLLASCSPNRGCCCCCCSTRDPPYKHTSGSKGWGMCHLVPRHHCWCHRGGCPSLPGCRVCFPVLSHHFCHPVLSLSFHPPSTPRAVAHEAGGRWCGCGCSPAVCYSPLYICTRNPPCEQWIAGEGQVLVVLVLLACCCGCIASARIAGSSIFQQNILVS
jgi:hypothetical protein